MPSGPATAPRPPDRILAESDRVSSTSEACARLESALSPYVDGELPGDETARVREHLAACPACAARAEAHRSVARSILAARAPALAPETVRALLARAQEPPRFRWGQLAAAVLLAALIPAALAVTTPRPRPSGSCACDVVTPGLDVGL